MWTGVQNPPHDASVVLPTVVGEDPRPKTQDHKLETNTETDDAKVHVYGTMQIICASIKACLTLCIHVR